MNPVVENGSGVGVVKEVLCLNPGIGLLCFGSGGKLLSGGGGGEVVGMVEMMRRERSRGSFCAIKRSLAGHCRKLET